MKQVLLAAALALAPVVAFAQAPAPPPKPDMILLPRESVAAVVQQFQAIGTISPELMKPAVVQTFQQMVACANDNPVQGKLMRVGPDQCPSVTDALKERDDQIAALNKQIADAKTAQDKAVAAQKDADEKSAIDQVAEAKRVAEAPLRAEIARLTAGHVPAATGK